MITLKEIFDDLAYGELSKMKIGNSELGSITEADYPKIVSSINLGLVEIYKRFNFRQNRVNIHQQTGVGTYYLRSTHSIADGNYDEEYYLEEVNDEAFPDDVIKVLSAVDMLGDNVTINDPDDDTGITILSFDTLEITPRDPLDIITVTYQATYPKITIGDDFDPVDVILYIPRTIKTALLNFVASRVFKGKTSKAAEGEQNISTTFMMAFETECKKIEQYGLANEANTKKQQFYDNGWV